MRVVVSQSMYFPWVGFLEQMRLADVYVVYDDVQFSKGSFTNRVQAKTASGSRWLSVPLRGVRFGQRIDEVQVDEDEDWRSSHHGILRQGYSGSPCVKDMLRLFDETVRAPATSIGELALRSMHSLMAYFDLNPGLRIVHACELGIEGRGSQRVLDIVRSVGGDEYVTGHGARDYLDHRAFERAGIEVSYMRYRRLPYPQLHGPFTPYVTGLDLVANCGPAGARHIQPDTIPWKEFTHESA